MKLVYPVMANILVAAVLASPARASEDLAKKHQCLACHQIDRKLVGPSYKDVAKKYKGQADAEVRLAEKIRKGSTGVWGPVAMPANTKVSESDAKTLAAWVLKLR